MKNLIINNASIVTPNEVIHNGSLLVENGTITFISRKPFNSELYPFDCIEAGGKYLLPGIIDLHTDAIEVEICPRPAADFPIEVAFRELEKRMCGTGITTVFHSMHLGSREYEKDFRSKYSRPEVFAKVHEACHKHSLINNKIHLRYEIAGLNEYELCFELVKKGSISFFSFMDHTPPEDLLHGEKFEKFRIRKRLSREQAIHEITERMQRPKITKQQMLDLINFLKDHHIPVASHDDRTAAVVEENHGMGITMAEFPISSEAAQKATELGMDTVGGAANVLRGGSNLGNINVQDSVSKGHINILCSDYYPPALLHSIFILYRKNILPLHESARLTSLNPARAAFIDARKGSIETGKDADMILVDYKNNKPVIEKTIVGGNISGEYSLKPAKIYEYYN